MLVDDPEEGVDEEGRVRTGVSRSKVVGEWADLVSRASEPLRRTGGSALQSIWVYGSVATGQAVRGRSDLDLLVLTSGPPLVRPADVVRSVETAGLVRTVEVSTMTMADLDGPHGAANRCFLRHYAICWQGVPPPVEGPGCRATMALARGLAGALMAALPGLAEGRLDGRDPGRIGRVMLIAAATVCAVRENGWSTDRAYAVRRLQALDQDVGRAAAVVFAHADSRGESFDDGRPPTAALATLAGWLHTALRQPT